MNTRHPLIQDDATPSVLAVSFSDNGKRFIAGTSSGLRVYRTDNCLTTYQPRLSLDVNGYADDRGVGVVAILDDRYLAFVGGGRLPHGGTKAPNAVCFWDAVLGRQTARLDFREPVLGLELGRREMVVILKERSIILQYQSVRLQESSTPAATQISDSFSSETTDTPNIQGQRYGDAVSTRFDKTARAPNAIRAVVQTSSNDFALGCLSNTLLALPAQTLGQVQLLPLSGGSKRVLKAHTSSLRAICLSEDGSLLATASEQGTLLRVFETNRGDQVAEFRRGVDKAIIFSLAISHSNRWLACTSDKGTLHLFDLAPSPPGDAESTARAHTRNKGSRGSQSYATHRLSVGGATDIDSLSGASNARSSPVSLASVPHSSNVHQNPGSAQEYYGLKPPPLSATPSISSSGVSAIAAFKSSPFAPKVFKDIRSKVSAPFSIGEEPGHWQGGPSQHWTTMPNGGRKRVKNPVPALPADPGGKPPKGKILFAAKSRDSSSGTASGQEEVIHIVGGGTDARWERFRLVFAEESGGWYLINEGFRRYLTRQFIE
ncbi:WD40 repeat-like protein [Polychaeton citri CBS 116435]|uniref:WD40 repeat-like protein n=1 Tax=Polychaeton citri CBS 116435 TaxID=1314669 RepID=A0A9P4UMC9_9PEZI|nr:WD40 repeat-like protein [Polychaeton citri CBS 116435]